MPTTEPLSLDEYRARKKKTRTVEVFQHDYPLGDIETLSNDNLVKLIEGEGLVAPPSPDVTIEDYIDKLVKLLRDAQADIPELANLTEIYQERKLVEMIQERKLPVPEKGGSISVKEWRTQLLDILWEVGREMRFTIKRDAAFDLLSILAKRGLENLDDRSINDLIFREGTAVFQEIAEAIIVEPLIVSLDTPEDKIPVGALRADEVDPMDSIQLMTLLVKEFKQGGRPEAATFRAVRSRVADRRNVPGVRPATS